MNVKNVIKMVINCPVIMQCGYIVSTITGDVLKNPFQIMQELKKSLC
jgi:hypothetical protein